MGAASESLALNALRGLSDPAALYGSGVYVVGSGGDALWWWSQWWACSGLGVASVEAASPALVLIELSGRSNSSVPFSNA